LRLVKDHRTVIDVRTIPFWRRASSIMLAFDRLVPGEALELVVDLDPWPLHDHLERTRPGECEWQTLETGPECWRVRLSRV
jgi:uncharacterized protein (DUF2249 family)